MSLIFRFLARLTRSAPNQFGPYPRTNGSQFQVVFSDCRPLRGRNFMYKRLSAKRTLVFLVFRALGVYHVRMIILILNISQHSYQIETFAVDFSCAIALLVGIYKEIEFLVFPYLFVQVSKKFFFNLKIIKILTTNRHTPYG